VLFQEHAQALFQKYFKSGDQIKYITSKSDGSSSRLRSILPSSVRLLWKIFFQMSSLLLRCVDASLNLLYSRSL